MSPNNSWLYFLEGWVPTFVGMTYKEVEMTEGLKLTIYT